MLETSARHRPPPDPGQQRVPHWSRCEATAGSTSLSCDCRAASGGSAMVSTMAVTVRPVSEELFDDVQTVFGNRGQAARCQCSSYRMGWYDQHSDNVQGRRELLKDQVIEGHGLLAYLDGEPAGWCSMAPRRDYRYLRQTAWKGRTEDKDDANIWA